MGRDAIAKLGPKPEHSPTHSSKGLFYVFSIHSCCKNRIRVWPDMFFLPKTSRVCCSRAGIIPSVGQRGRRGLRGNGHQCHQHVSCIVGPRPPASIMVIYVRNAGFLFIYIFFIFWHCGTRDAHQAIMFTFLWFSNSFNAAPLKFVCSQHICL